jgi:hypothetical protein
MELSIKTIVLIIIAIIVLATVLLIFKVKKESFVSNWSELKRGNLMFEKYPPCYDICGATRNIQDTLEQAKKEERYKKLLDGYSLVLCQEKYKDSPRVREMLSQRITDLIKMGAKTTDYNGSVEIVNSYNPECNMSKQFMLLAANLLQNEIDKLSKDGEINPAQKANILKLHDVFYSIHFPVISKICPGKIEGKK